MNELISLGSTAIAFFIVAVSPGPANISNAAIAMHYGRRTSLVYGAGLSFGLVFWGIVAASGMGAVLQSSLYLLTALKVLGGVYLLWLALQSGRQAIRSDEADIVATEKQNWFVKGLILNMSNPKSVLAWLAALSVGVSPGDSGSAIIAPTLVCILVGFANNALYSMLFSVGGMMKTYRKCRRWISGVVATLFAFAGLGLIRSAFAR
ncbi:MAG: LysE family translocator [Acidiferrobacterales bacterium]|nr:LysE family translocator [Acidiferrobacterales bacterium]